MKASYVLVDVFSDRPLAGNPLAVFPDGHDIPEELFAPVARELNLSETVFVTAIDESGYDARIFTPGAELPFAGHPTLGTAWVLSHLGRIEGPWLVQRTAAGDTPVSLAFDTVWFERTGTVGRDIEDTSFIAPALGLAESDIGFNAGVLGYSRRWLAPAFADAGVEQLMVPVADRETLARMRPRPDVVDLSGQGVYCFTALAPTKLKARFFAAGIGIAEDPATGSAAANVGLYLADRLGDLAFDIKQGKETGRPSTLSVDTSRGRVRVGGQVVLVGEGELLL
ncbi:MAG TPA: PhzF family phenazine biosynthesis protein [Actinomycetota bacterium]|nr:PhzF family phenazine biosynthesis protein [Actinomycetota bacterium]